MSLAQDLLLLQVGRIAVAYSYNRLMIDHAGRQKHFVGILPSVLYVTNLYLVLSHRAM